MTINSIDLTTVAAVREYAGGVGALPTPADDLIQSLITSLSQWAMTYCSRDFRALDRTERYNGVGSRSISLNCIPINSVAAVTAGVTPVPLSTTPAQSGFVYDLQTVYARGGYLFAPGAQNIEITYNAGWITPGQAAGMSPVGTVTLPADIQLAVIQTVWMTWQRIKNSDKSSIAIDKQSTTFITKSMPPSAQPVFDAYKRALLW